MFNNKFYSIVLSVTAALFLTVLANAEPIKIQSGKVEFLAVGTPSMLKVHGTSTTLAGTISADNKKTYEGKIEFDLKTLKTGMDIRDEHMGKYLEISKYPKAALTIKDLAILKADEKFEKTVSMSLSLHGQEKPVDVALQLKNDKGAFTGKGTFTVSLADFKIESPQYMGMKIKDKIEVTVEFTAK